jgi:dynein heavy chain 2
MAALQYELSRQFADKLVNEEAKNKFDQIFKPPTDLYYSLGQNGKLTPTKKEQFTLSLKGTIDFYEREVKDMRVVMVSEVLTLIAGVEKRFLEGGALLLAGSSGNFRRNAVSLMAFKHKYQLLSPLVLRNPMIRDFNKDMKGFMEIAGGQNKKVVLFLEDHQLQKNEFLEKVNSLISSGEIPGLFSAEEVEHIVQDL